MSFAISVIGVLHYTEVSVLKKEKKKRRELKKKKVTPFNFTTVMQSYECVARQRGSVGDQRILVYTGIHVE